MHDAAREGSPITPDDFAALMAPLGPFEPCPRVAAAVSGGADSMALGLLADTWARQRGGSVTALVVDHGLRPESGAEAAVTIERLARRGIASRLLRLTGLLSGPALAERARAARYAALTEACTAAGLLHLLLGHHAADQAETVLIRRLGNSGPTGLAAMAAVTEQYSLRLLRPLLPVPPVRLRATLLVAGVGWVEDPSNSDRRALRARLRAGLGDPDGIGPPTTSLYGTALAAGQARAEREAAVATTLADRASVYPEGYARLSSGPIDPAALAALVQAIAGAPFPPPTAAVTAWCAAPAPATLAGVRILAGGRMGEGWLLVREAAAMRPPVPAEPGAVWDGRFRIGRAAIVPPGTTIGALGGDAARLRRHSPLPAAVLQTLPALRRGNSLVAVPLLGYPDPTACAALAVTFCPRRPVAGAPFLPAGAPERAIVR